MFIFASDQKNEAMEWLIERLDALPEYSQQLLESFPAVRVMAFTGEVGAGKTTFIQNICKHLGVIEIVSSPTFALVNEYTYVDAHSGMVNSAFHLDLYRLRSIEEALDIGIEDYLYSGKYCFVEWPEIVEALLPDDTLRIHLEIQSDSQRKMLIL